MRQTLFYIEPWLFDGWLLGGWIVIGLLYAAFQYFWGNTKDIFGFIPLWIIVAAVIQLVVPNLQTLGVNPQDPDGDLVPLGLGVQGYGLFLLLAMICGLGLALWRCKQIGFDGDRIFTLSFWMIIFGLMGARAFYVIQKWEKFSNHSPQELLFEMANMTQGGLVVYGSIIGGVIAGFVYLTIQKLSWRQVGDIIAPGMVIGLAIGRIGCLMNGCCFGGVCDADYAAGLQFPPGSPPYMQQLRDGSLLGIDGELVGSKDLWSAEAAIKVNSVEPDSVAGASGVEAGEEVRIYSTDSIRLRAFKNKGLKTNKSVASIERDKGAPIPIPLEAMPDYSLKTHPTQVYSAISAGLLCLLLWFYYPYRKSDGEVFGLMLILYPITRFLLEMIRRDESGMFGTQLTISQWVSMGIIVLGFSIWLYSRGQGFLEPAKPAVK